MEYENKMAATGVFSTSAVALGKISEYDVMTFQPIREVT